MGRSLRTGCSRRLRTSLAAAVVMILGFAGAEGSSIKKTDLSPSESQVFKEWSKYLAAGPTAWAEVEHPPVTAAIRSAIWEDVKTDPGGTDPMVAFLLWKQSIDPSRFAHYHPNLAPALTRIAKSLPSAPQGLLPPPTITGSSGGGTSSPSTTPSSPSEPENLLPPAVPEPSTLVLAVGLSVWGACKVRSNRRKDA